MYDWLSQKEAANHEGTIDHTEADGAQPCLPVEAALEILKALKGSEVEEEGQTDDDDVLKDAPPLALNDKVPPAQHTVFVLFIKYTTQTGDRNIDR